MSRGSSSSSNNNTPVASNVKITDDNGGTPLVGTTLTGSYTYGDAEGDVEGVSTFQWIRGTKAIEGAVSNTYTISKNDKDQIIRFEVTPVAISGTSPGAPASANITVGNSRPVTGNVSIIGFPLIVGTTLSGTYTYSDIDDDNEGDSIYRWFRDGIVITGADADTYLVTPLDSGKELSFEVTPVAAAGTSQGVAVVSTTVTISNSAPIASDVGISDDNNENIVVGTTLTGVYKYTDVDNDLEGVSTFRWLRGGKAITGANSTFYTLTVDDSGKNIAFEVTPAATSGVKSGNPVSASVVVKNSAPVAINANISDNSNGILIEGTTLTGNYIYSDIDGDQEGNSIFRWLRNGSAIAGEISRAYTVAFADIGQSISFEVTIKAVTGVSPGAPVLSESVTINNAPVASNVKITSALPLVKGTTLTGNYIYYDSDSDPEGASHFRWSRNDITIAGAEGGTYTLTPNDIGQAIRFEVTPVAATGTKIGAPITSTPPPYVQKIAASAGGLPRSVAIQGNYAYVAADGILSIVDISNPSNPSQTAFINTPGQASDVSISGNYAYVADMVGGLRIIDIREPSAPVEVAELPISRAKSIAIKGNYAYVTDWGLGGLRIVDITNPSTPIIVAKTVDGDGDDVAVSGDYAYVTDANLGLRIINITNPTAPVSVATFNTNGYTYGVTVSGNFAYVADGTNGLRVLNISDPTAPIEVGFIDTTGSARGVSVNGNYAYVADDNDGIHIFDISNPSSPKISGSIDTPGRAWGVSINRSYIYVADYNGGLRIINISNSAAPVEVGAFNTAGSALDVVTSNNYAYVADDTSGFRTIDINNPFMPEVSLYNTLGSVQSVAINGNHIFAGDTDSLYIFDVSDPTKQALLGSIYILGGVNSIAISGNYAYVTSENKGLRIIKVSNPTAPEATGYVSTPGSPQDVAISGNYAYVADDANGLRIINVINPTAPVEVAFIDTPGSAQSVAIDGNYAYVADDIAGLRIVNISDPTAPKEVSTINIPGFAQDIAISGKYAYLAVGLGRSYPDLTHGLSIIDISNPTTPIEIGSTATPGVAVGVTANNNIAYVADYSAGLVIFKFVAP